MTETWALASLLDDQECGTWLRRHASVSASVSVSVSVSVSESTLETLRDPKALLHRLLSRDEPHGRLLDQGTFGVRRARILAELDTGSGSTLSRLTAWRALVEQTRAAIHRARPWLQGSRP